MASSVHYPWLGFLYILTAPSLWGTVLCVALFGVLVAVTTIVLLFVFALQPQAEAFGGSQWWSYVFAVVAVLFEALLLTALILRVAQSKCQKKIFVETMKMEQKWREEMVEPSVIKDIHCFKIGVLVKICTFPLNLIPVAGTVLFAFINGPFEAWDLMDMYFEAVGMESRSDQWIEVTNGGKSCGSMYTSSAYRNFGFTAVLLESIPIAGPAVFSLSNACGAALYACQMEDGGGPLTLRTNARQKPLM